MTGDSIGAVQSIKPASSIAKLTAWRSWNEEVLAMGRTTKHGGGISSSYGVARRVGLASQALRALRLEISHRPQVCREIIAHHDILMGISHAIALENEQCLDEACQVVILCSRECGSHASDAIMGCPKLLHALCRKAMQTESPTVVDALTSISHQNDKMLWIVTTIIKVMRVERKCNSSMLQRILSRWKLTQGSVGSEISSSRASHDHSGKPTQTQFPAQRNLPVAQSMSSRSTVCSDFRDLAGPVTTQSSALNASSQQPGLYSSSQDKVSKPASQLSSLASLIGLVPEDNTFNTRSTWSSLSLHDVHVLKSQSASSLSLPSAADDLFSEKSFQREGDYKIERSVVDKPLQRSQQFSEMRSRSDKEDITERLLQRSQQLKRELESIRCSSNKTYEAPMTKPPDQSSWSLQKGSQQLISPPDSLLFASHTKDADSSLFASYTKNHVDSSKFASHTKKDADSSLYAFQMKEDEIARLRARAYHPAPVGNARSQSAPAQEPATIMASKPRVNRTSYNDSAPTSDSFIRSFDPFGLRQSAGAESANTSMSLRPLGEQVPQYGLNGDASMNRPAPREEVSNILIPDRTGAVRSVCDVDGLYNYFSRPRSQVSSRPSSWHPTFEDDSNDKRIVQVPPKVGQRSALPMRSSMPGTQRMRDDVVIEALMHPSDLRATSPPIMYDSTPMEEKRRSLPSKSLPIVTQPMSTSRESYNPTFYSSAPTLPGSMVPGSKSQSSLDAVKPYPSPPRPDMRSSSPSRMHSPQVMHDSGATRVTQRSISPARMPSFQTNHGSSAAPDNRVITRSVSPNRSRVVDVDVAATKEQFYHKADDVAFQHVGIGAMMMRDQVSSSPQIMHDSVPTPDARSTNKPMMPMPMSQSSRDTTSMNRYPSPPRLDMRSSSPLHMHSPQVMHDSATPVTTRMRSVSPHRSRVMDVDVATNNKQFHQKADDFAFRHVGIGAMMIREASPVNDPSSPPATRSILGDATVIGSMLGSPQSAVIQPSSQIPNRASSPMKQRDNFEVCDVGKIRTIYSHAKSPHSPKIIVRDWVGDADSDQEDWC